MQYAQESNGVDLVSDVHFLCGTDTVSYPVKDITRNANFALDKITALIMRCDKRWRWDDSNNTSVPITTANLVSGTANYAIDVTYLTLEKIRIKDSGGNWKSLDPVDRNELTDAQLTASNGDPQRYYKVGNYIYLNPAPNYSSSGGLEFHYTRAPHYFVYTDTIATPGFVAQFHRLVSLGASKLYCEANDIRGRLGNINTAIVAMEAELVEHYSSRSSDEKPAFSIRREDYGESSLSDGGFSRNPDGW